MFNNLLQLLDNKHFSDMFTGDVQEDNWNLSKQYKRENIANGSNNVFRQFNSKASYFLPKNQKLSCNTTSEKLLKSTVIYYVFNAGTCTFWSSCKQTNVKNKTVVTSVIRYMITFACFQLISTFAFVWFYSLKATIYYNTNKNRLLT